MPVELPTPASIGKGKRCGEAIEELSTGDGFGAESHHMRRGLLAVDDAESPRLELAHE